MDDVYESRDARVRAQRRRTAITLIITVLGLFFAFWYAYSYYQSDPTATPASPTSSATSSATCIPAATMAPKKVTVNVYNSTNINGLAARTARTLKKRGFTIGSVANDPERKNIPGQAEIRFGRKGAKQAATVKGYVPGATQVRDKRKNTKVDLVLGDSFSKVRTKPLRACPTK